MVRTAPDVPWVRGALALLGATFVGACAGTPAPPPPPPYEVAEFAIYRGDSVVATERLLKYGDHLEGSIEVVGRARAEYVVHLGPDHTVTRIESHVVPWAGTSSGTQLTAQLTGDSIRIERILPLPSTQTRSGGGSIPYLHPSPGLLERIVMRGLAIGGATAEVPVWFVSPNAARTARVTLVSERVVDVELGNTQIRVWLDEFGLLLAEIPSLGWLIQRRPR